MRTHTKDTLCFFSPLNTTLWIIDARHIKALLLILIVFRQKPTEAATLPASTHVNSLEKQQFIALAPINLLRKTVHYATPRRWWSAALKELRGETL